MITVITVNYNSSAHTMELLRSLERQTNGQFAVIVVDNDSRPEDRAALTAFAATSRLALDIIVSDRNRGFSGGNNLALRKATAQGGDWFLLLNPDTTVTADFIGALQSRLAGEEPCILQLPLAEPGRIAYAGKVQWLSRTTGHLEHRPLGRHLMRRKSLYAIGAALAVHRSVLNRLGFLDERYFLYFEDADFSLRAHAAGVPVRFLETPLVRHGVSKSTSTLGAPMLLRYHARNALLMNRLHGPWWVRLALPLWAGYGIIVQFTKTLILPSRQAPSQAILDGILDYYAGRFGRITPHNPRH